MKIHKKNLVIGLAFLFVISSCIPAFGAPADNEFFSESLTDEQTEFVIKSMTIELNFSDLEIIPYGDYYVIRVNGTDFNRMNPGQPVLPFNLTVFELPFCTRIVNISYQHSTPEIYDLDGRLAYGSPSLTDNIGIRHALVGIDDTNYENVDPYPPDWVFYHTGGGLSHGVHKTFLVIRTYPVRYFSDENQLAFIQNIEITIEYEEPAEPVIQDSDVYDLLIIAPSQFTIPLQRLVRHKNNHGIKTKLVGLPEIYGRIYWEGVDNQEKIKFYIKYATENWGVTHVLLVGGIKGQTNAWNLPARYSHVVPPVEQEYAEQSFISDLYYADLYDSEGDFSSWDSNHNGVYAEWNGTIKDDMDLYPDVYLGRLACRSTSEVRTMVNKIIKYEKTKCDDSWFKNLILVAGDSYNDTNHFNEGELISEEAIEKMPDDFNPVKVYSSEQDINRRTVNKAMNQGAGFAYFCGHGNTASWNTHIPPNGTKWTTGYQIQDMMLLRNRHKLPITIVGGCHNGQFDVTMRNILKGIREEGLGYFSSKPGNAGGFWYNQWVPNCWAWWLTSKVGGGAIACIANTGLGTHGDGDADNNSIADYLEVLDGWLELRFLELYGTEHYDILGENHGETLTGYLHRFLGDEVKMDAKMVQQWELFGDPSLKIGGYE